MINEFTFYDYIDADGSGTNVIKRWLNGDGKVAKAYFTMLISYLEKSPPPGFSGSFWTEPHTKIMKGKWVGFIELRKTGRVQYRLITKMDGRQVFLVACGVHKGQKYTTDVSPQTAAIRVTRMMNNPRNYRRKHDFG
ncbi:MAG: hypothetical protein JW845_06335 [Dehalococcoidales bacterium]|nr:hypothetical protein [Dehalococcoidales bacterium]